MLMWEFPKIRGTVFWDPENKDPTIWGSVIGSPIFGNPHVIVPTLHVDYLAHI